MKTSRIGMFGGFSVEEKIGEGGMGVVYRGFDPDLQRPIAIKRIHPRLAASKEYAERFLAEARAVAAVIHPNVAQIFSIHAHTNDESPPYFVMEYVEGESAESRVRKRGPVKLMTAVDLTLQAARGLQAAFYKGIVHRDIKPSNLLINLHDEVKLVDFGLARQVSEIGNLTEAGMVLGTPHYVSPEQGRAHRVDHRSDIYSLGCTFYYMLTGTEPFQGASKLDVISAHSESSVPSLQGRIDGYTPAVDELLQRMLAKQPEERFQTYDELIRVLAGLLGTLKEDTRSHRLTASPIILLGLLAVLAALTFDLFRQRTLDSSQQLIQLWGPLYDEVEGKTNPRIRLRQRPPQRTPESPAPLRHQQQPRGPAPEYPRGSALGRVGRRTALPLHASLRHLGNLRLALCRHSRLRDHPRLRFLRTPRWTAHLLRSRAEERARSRVRP